MARKIRVVNTGTGTYYVYDFVDIFGKTKRLYGKTEGELKEKIEIAQSGQQSVNTSLKAKSNKLYDYALFYFRNVVGTVHQKNLNRLIALFDNIIKDSEINKDINDITPEELQEFLNRIALKYPSNNIEDIYNTLQKVFEIAAVDNLVPADFFKANNIEKPESEDAAHFILSPQSFQELLNFFIEDNCMSYGSNELLIVFSMMTGFPYTAFREMKNSDISLEEGTFTLKGRTLPLTQEAIDWLKIKKEQKMLLNGSSDDLLFTNSNNRFPTTQSVGYTLSRCGIRNGFQKGITSNILHKSYIIAELEKNRTPEELVEYFGLKNKKAIAKVADEYKLLQSLY